MKRLLAVLALSLLPMNPSFGAETPPCPIDPAATPQTAALLHNLWLLGPGRVLFGHQDSLVYGHDWMGEKDRSDVKDVTGDFPAVYGWDLGAVEPKGPNRDIAGPRLDAESLTRYAKEAYARGGVVTFSWHESNPESGKGFYDLTPAVETLLPGGKNNAEYRERLDAVAAFLKGLSPMPVIVRPYHEHNGNWFWWGKGIAAEADYIALWRYTVTYLRDEKGVHNVLYCFSPDRSRIDLGHFERDYLYGWPGDEFVDILGLDDYVDARTPRANDSAKSMAEKEADFVTSLTGLGRLAAKKGKLCALSETGFEGIPMENWWTGHLLPAIEANEDSRRIAWVLVWRNANASFEKTEHYFAPFKGQKSAADFVKFRNCATILFESELPDLYHEKK